MSLTQYYTATTLDGFIADENHSLDWLFTRDQVHRDEASVLAQQRRRRDQKRSPARSW